MNPPIVTESDARDPETAPEPYWISTSGLIELEAWNEEEFED